MSIFHLQLFTIYISYADIILKEQFIKLEHNANIIRSLTINRRLLNPVIYKLCMYQCVKAIFFQLVWPFYIFTLPAVLLNPLPASHANTQTLSTAVFESLGDFTRERTHKFLCFPPDRGALLRHKAVAAPFRSGVCEGHPTFQWS